MGLRSLHYQVRYRQERSFGTGAGLRARFGRLSGRVECASMSRRLPGMFASDLYRSPRLPDGSFGQPENLGPPVNSDYGTGDMSLASDESYMVMSLRRPGNLGRGDLYVSFRHSDGTWGQPVSLGDKINTEHHEWCPMVTPDGNYLFFSRWLGETWETATGGDVYWVDVRILDQFRP